MACKCGQQDFSSTQPRGFFPVVLLMKWIMVYGNVILLPTEISLLTNQDHRHPTSGMATSILTTSSKAAAILVVGGTSAGVEVNFSWVQLVGREAASTFFWQSLLGIEQSRQGGWRGTYPWAEQRFSSISWEWVSFVLVPPTCSVLTPPLFQLHYHIRSTRGSTLWSCCVSDWVSNKQAKSRTLNLPWAKWSFYFLGHGGPIVK